MVASSENPLADTPKLDYKAIMTGEARERILQAMQEYAFFYIVNIPNFDPNAEMDAMEQFFSEPQDIKEKYATVGNNPKNSNVIRGLTFNLIFILFYITR